MLILLDKFLLSFRCCFSRSAAFCWFVIIIMGFVVRFDHQGVTSFIRWLFLEPKHYDLLLRFFRANSWTLDCLLSHWAMMVVNLYPIIKFNGRPLLIGDGIKVCKEAKKMPGVKHLHQDSDNSGKGEYIYGHHILYPPFIFVSHYMCFGLVSRYIFISQRFHRHYILEPKILFPLLSRSYVFQQNYRNSITN